MISQNSQDSRNSSQNENETENDKDTDKDNNKTHHHSLSLDERKGICGQEKEDDFIAQFFRNNKEESLYKEMEEWKRYKKKNRTKSFVRRMFFLKEKFANHQYDNTLWESNARYIEENKNALRYLDKVETSRFFLFVVERRILDSDSDSDSDLNLNLGASSLSLSSQIVFVYVFNKINRSHNYFCIDYRKKHPEIKTIHGCTLSGIFDDCHPIYYRKFYRNRKYSKKYLSHVFRRTRRWDHDYDDYEYWMESEMLYPIGSSFKKESPSTTFFK